MEYDYDIHAVTGAIISWDHEVEKYKIPAQGSASPTGSIISLDEAKALARAKAPGAALYSCKLDVDDGIQVYEGEPLHYRRGVQLQFIQYSGIIKK